MTKVLALQFPLLLYTTWGTGALWCQPCTLPKRHVYIRKTTGSDITDHEVQWKKSMCSEMLIPTGTAEKGEHPRSQKALSTCLYYSLHIQPVPQGCKARMPLVACQAQTAVLPPHHSPSLLSSFPYYYTSDTCSHLTNISVMVTCQDCCRINITIKYPVSLLGREDSTTQGC